MKILTLLGLACFSVSVSAADVSPAAPTEIPAECAYAARSIMAIAMSDLDFPGYAKDPADGERVVSQIGIINVKVLKKTKNAGGSEDITYGATLYDGKSQSTFTVNSTRGGCFVTKWAIK